MTPIKANLAALSRFGMFMSWISLKIADHIFLTCPRIKNLLPSLGLCTNGSIMGRLTNFPSYVHEASIAYCLASLNYFSFSVSNCLPIYSIVSKAIFLTSASSSNSPERTYGTNFPWWSYLSSKTHTQKCRLFINAYRTRIFGSTINVAK